MPKPRFNKLEIKQIRKAKTKKEPIGNESHNKNIFGKEGNSDLIKKYNEILKEMANERIDKKLRVEDVRNHIKKTKKYRLNHNIYII
jgi:hypothetical protein